MREAGGELPSDRRMRHKLLEMLPAELQRDMLFRAKDPSTTYEQFKENVRSGVVEWLQLHRKTGAHSLEEPEERNFEEDEEFIAFAAKRGYDVRRRFNPKAKVKAGAPRPADTSKGNVARKPRCTNCGMENHTIADCRKPIVPLKDRPCFECGKTGHSARQCPQKKRSLKALEDEGDDGQDQSYTNMCLEEEDTADEENWIHQVSVTCDRNTSFESVNPWQALERDDDSDDESSSHASSPILESLINNSRISVRASRAPRACSRTPW
jgi:hypothetical protein